MNWHIEKLDNSWITTSNTEAAIVKWPSAGSTQRTICTVNMLEIGEIVKSSNPYDVFPQENGVIQSVFDPKFSTYYPTLGTYEIKISTELKFNEAWLVLLSDSLEERN